MATIDKKGIKNRRYCVKGIIRRTNNSNDKVLKACPAPVPPCGRLLRKLKNKREAENMENTVKCNNDYMPDFIEAVDIDDGISLLDSFKKMRKGFLKARIKKGEISENDPIVKKFLEE